MNGKGVPQNLLPTVVMPLKCTKTVYKKHKLVY